MKLRTHAPIALLTSLALTGGCATEDPASSEALMSCPEGRSPCGSECVDPFTNALNCGACGRACAAGSACTGGQCLCQSGLTDCFGRCTDTGSDATNCGACGQACDAGLVCGGGLCTTTCPTGSEQCGQSCVDLLTSPFHCGACDQICEAGLSCTGGSCACATGQLLCAGACITAATDPAHCGACNNRCAEGQTCTAGACVGAGIIDEDLAALAEAQASLSGDIVFSVPSGTFEAALEVGIGSTIAGAEIRYTTDGTPPTASSPLYDGSALLLTSTTEIRAQAFTAGAPVGAPGSAVYIARSFDLSNDLPVLVIDNYGQGPLDAENRVYVDAAFMVFESAGGGVSLTAAPSVATRSAFHVRGQSTAMFEKVPYRVELRDNLDEDLDWPLLGMPAESDWAMRGPFADKSLIRDPFIYSLGRDMGMQAPRFAYCDFYLNVENRPLSEADYQGVYLVVEIIKNSRNRLDLSQLRETDRALPDITGGYIFKFEWLAAEDPVLAGTCSASPGLPCWSELEVVDPNPLMPEQATWLTNHVQAFHDALHAPTFADPTSGYASYIDVDSFVDQLILNELSREMDSYIRSAVFHKDRDAKIFAGPLWDYNLTFGVGGYFENNQTAGWQHEQERPNMNNDWFPQLLTDPAFVSRVQARWQELRQNLLSDAELDARIDSLTAPLVEAARRNFAKWPNLTQATIGPFETPTEGSWEAQVEFLRTWLHERVAWLDTQWG